MINHKVLSLIGLAMKAGKVVSGEFSTEKAVKTGTAFLVVVAESASGNTKKEIRKFLLLLPGSTVFPGRKGRTGQGDWKRIPGFPGSNQMKNFAKAIEKQLEMNS